MFELIKELLNLRKSVLDKKQRMVELDKILENKQSLHNEIKERALVDAKKEANEIINIANKKVIQIEDELSKKSEYIEEINELKKQNDKLNKKLSKEENRFRQLSYINNKLQPFIDNLKITGENNDYIVSFDLTEEEKMIYENLLPTVELKLHSLDLKELKKKFKENEKIINETLEKYQGRYTTKANITIYKLMVIALKSELQNVLFSLKYNKLENSIESIKSITEKYLQIASEGNQNIFNTAAKFISEVEFLFIKAIEIEYEYYIKKEQEKDEQSRLREQMRQESEERKILEQQKKQMEKEEEKYTNEIENMQEQLLNAKDDNKILQLQAKLKELEQQLNSIHDKKEEIVKLQNGKAGYVYVISNLGSFGENMFKVGMTRRLNPQDRVDELGDASVPFKFDVHSFIFSDSAVDLEQKLHRILDKKKVNKINSRKEFFNTSVTELENLVQELYPSAEFNKTMLAEEYRQSLSICEYEEDEAI
jgi:hypothetical protein